MENGHQHSLDYGTVLVLNASFNPINITSWQKAIMKILSGAAYSVNDTDIPVRSQHVSIWRPSVIALVEHVSTYIQGVVNYSKRALFERDNYKCRYHSKIKGYEHRGRLTVDHIIPVSKGGKTEWTNVVACCERCQQVKRDHMLHNTPLSLPYNPKPLKSRDLELRLQRRLKRRLKLPSDWRKYVWSRD